MNLILNLSRTVQMGLNRNRTLIPFITQSTGQIEIQPGWERLSPFPSTVKIVSSIESEADLIRLDSAVLALDETYGFGLGDLDLFVPFWNQKVRFESSSYRTIEIYDPLEPTEFTVRSNHNFLWRALNAIRIRSDPEPSKLKFYPISDAISESMVLIPLVETLKDLPAYLGSNSFNTIFYYQKRDDFKGKTCVLYDSQINRVNDYLAIVDFLKSRSADKIYLVGSHGLFSQSVDRFRGVVDGVYTTDSLTSTRIVEAGFEVEIVSLDSMI